MGIALIILAAGQGTRMNSDLPKVLHEIGGAPMLVHALSAGAAMEPERTIVVTGHGAAAVQKAATEFNPDVICAEQSEQLGTGHAVAQAAPHLQGFSGDAIVLYGDTPFVTVQTLAKIEKARKSHDIVVLGFEPENPARYGRLVMDGSSLVEIVEHKDASSEERAIRLCNSGIICANSEILMGIVSKLEPSSSTGEYYLTDVVGAARKIGLSATAVFCDESETLGINSRQELADAERAFQARKRFEALENGVSMPCPESVFFAFDTVVGRDAVVEQNVVFGPGVTVESGARIRAFSHLEGCHVSRDAVVGPYARLRPGAELAEAVRIGNFVEVKNAQIDEGAKVNHLSYIGDAHIGEATNIGAGTITCNYDGVFKHRTVIGKEVFVGSNTMLVAPVKLGDRSMTATGTVVTSDVPEGAMSVGRARQENKPGLAVRLFEKLRARKNSEVKKDV